METRGRERVEEEWRGEGIVPSMVPHLVFLPSSLLPLTWYSWSLPTTANGIISCSKLKRSVHNGVRHHLSKVYFECIEDDIALRSSLSEHKWRWLSHRTCDRSVITWSTHPDLFVDHSVLCILIKFLLRVYINPISSQLLPDLFKHTQKHNKPLAHSFERIQNRPFNCWSN